MGKVLTSAWQPAATPKLYSSLCKRNCNCIAAIRLPKYYRTEQPLHFRINILICSRLGRMKRSIEEILVNIYGIWVHSHPDPGLPCQFNHGCILAVNPIYFSWLGERYHEMSISLSNFDILDEIFPQLQNLPSSGNNNLFCLSPWSRERLCSFITNW